jgi:hypothetical protein
LIISFSVAADISRIDCHQDPAGESVLGYWDLRLNPTSRIRDVTDHGII